MQKPDHTRTIVLAEVAQRVSFLASILESEVQQYLRHDFTNRTPQLTIESRLTEILRTCQKVSIALEERELERRAANHPPAP